MSNLDPATLRRELLLEQAINRQLDDLVRQANLTAALLKTQEKMEKNQLRNLLNVAIESRSAEVVVNFIRYQIARSDEKAWGRQPESFGHQLIAVIRGRIKELAVQAASDVQKAEPQAVESSALFDSAYVRLMQLYLGYLNRAFYYAKETGQFDQLSEVAHAR